MPLTPQTPTIHTLYGTSLPSPRRASTLRPLSTTHIYTLTILTSTITWGGTNSPITLRLIGDLRAGPEIKLSASDDVSETVIDAGKEGEGVRFGTGSVKEFKWSGVHVGNVVRVCLKMEDEDYGDSWKVERLVVEDVSLGRGWGFRGGWLNREKGFCVRLEPEGCVAVGRRAARGLSRRVVGKEGRGGVRKVCFELRSYSKDNCRVYLSGGCEMLGCWQSDHALRMGMFAGKDGAWRGVWRLELELDEEDKYDEFSYGYFIVEEPTGNAWWEAGDKMRRLKLSDFVGKPDGFRFESKSQCVEFDDGVLYILDRYTVEETPVKPKGLMSSNSVRRTPGSRMSAMKSFDARSRQELKPKTPIRMMPLDEDENDDQFNARNASLHSFPNGRMNSSAMSAYDDDDDYDIQGENYMDPTIMAERVKKLEQTVVGLRKLAVEREHKIAKLTAQKRHYRSRYSEASIASSRASSIGYSDSRASPDAPSAMSPVSYDLVRAREARESVGTEKDDEQEAEKEKENDIAGDNTPVSAVKAPESKGKVDETDCLASATLEQNKLDERDEKTREIVQSFAEKFQSQQADLVRLQMDQNDLHDRQLREIEEARIAAEERFHAEFTERRRLFNMIQELRGNIRVFCRIRPPKSGEPWAKEKSTSPVSVLSSSDREQSCRISINKKMFEYDKVFSPETSQKDVYAATSGVIQSVLDGYNVCVFAYGQTSSGKTYTMSGPEHDRGVNYRALSDLFDIANQRAEYSTQTITLSMLEIYNESLRDLFADPSLQKSAKKLEIRQDPNESSNSMYVPGLIEKQVSSVGETWDILEAGLETRSAGSTNMNEHSSRSHLVISVKVVSESKNGDKSLGRLHLVDLAGSERVGRSQATGARMKEAQAINKSLATLGDVFMALLQKQSHVPYRNSKLTYLLRDSLGGDSKTLMFVNVSCDKEDENETLSSLGFAKRVARVELGTAGKNRTNGAELRLAEKERQVELLIQEKEQVDDVAKRHKRELLEARSLMDAKEKMITELQGIQRAQTREIEKMRKAHEEAHIKQHFRAPPVPPTRPPPAEPQQKRLATSGPIKPSEETPRRAFGNRPPHPSFASTTASARQRTVRFEDQTRTIRSVTHSGALSARERNQPSGSHAQPERVTGPLVRKAVSKTEEKRVVFAFGTRMEVDGAVAKNRTKRFARPMMRPPQRVVSSYGKNNQSQGQRPRRLATFSN